MSLFSGGSGDDYLPIFDINASYENRNQNQYPLTASQGLRYGLSVRELYAIMNAMLGDLGVEDPTQYITYGKVQRMLKAHGSELEIEHDDITGYEHLGFDGKSSGVLHDHCQVEKSVDMITFICQSRRSYVNHSTPESGHGYILAKYLYEVRIRKF